jgi:phosphate transport system permease protein
MNQAVADRVPGESTSAVTERNIGARLRRDRWFRHLMTIGGLSVIVAISAIFFYLASVVVPIFAPATMTEPRAFSALPPAEGGVVAVTSEELREIGVRYGLRGDVSYFDFVTGRPISQARVALPGGVAATVFSESERAHRTKAYGLADGRMLVFRQAYKVTFPGDKRLITPELEYPFGEKPIVIDEGGAAVQRLSVQAEGDTTLGAAALLADGRVVLVGFEGQRNLLTGEVALERSAGTLPALEGEVRELFLEVRQRELYVLHGERWVSQFDVTDKSRPRLIARVEVLPAGERVTAAILLSGGFSLVVGSDKGSLVQWFGVRNKDNDAVLTRIRDFPPMESAVTALAPEHFRKGFAVGDEGGNVGLYYATSERLLLNEPVAKAPIRMLEIAPRANGIIVVDRDERIYSAEIENEYPEVSFHSLWQKVWYESYEKPEYLWQSSAATSDFEPKLSLAPLTFGTLKAAFYAMLISMVLAILGAIYTAYFMAPALRKIVKPSIEIMEALPTVILGFLAGLWLAPLADNNLPAVLMCFVLLPLGILAAAWLWRLLPEAITGRIAPGWEAALLIPVVCLTIYLAFVLGHPVEAAFFGGDMPHWLSNEMGIPYEQRNSLVVGIAMGFAVTPNIFSIAEDAIFSVPKHLTSGSLALGATPWQTLTRVVLLTASPGIFSAIMIGLGRAVGETMIVLMATGNTAVMDFSIFTGFRTLSANIGVEMPEAAVGSTHYRLLFMSALVLFAFTFFVNTIAELVRHRLREKYSSI